jgi:CHAT domain-containing protein/tetratricopeptide (TPR) repeat protein
MNRGVGIGRPGTEGAATLDAALDDLSAASDDPQALAEAMHMHAALLITPAALSRAQFQVRVWSIAGDEERLARAEVVLRFVQAAQGHTVEEVQRAEAVLGPSQQEITAALEALVNAQTWGETRRMLEAHESILLSLPALDTLQTIAKNMRATGRGDSAAYVEQHLQLLERARVLGINTAFAEFEAQLENEARTEVEPRGALAAPGRLSRTEAVAVLAGAQQVEAGYALTERGKGLRGQARVDTLREAVATFDDALPALAAVSDRFQWALAQSGKGNAWHELGAALTGLERAAALREAVICYDVALDEFARQGVRSVWAATQLDRGSALRVLALNAQGHERTATLRDAIASYDAALTVFSPSSSAVTSTLGEQQGSREIPFTEHPKLWAVTQQRKGVAMRELARTLGGRERASALREAIACLDESLQVTRRESDEADWGSAMHYKGWALQDLADLLSGEEQAATLRRAIEAYNAALPAQATANPDDWPATQNNKGAALLALAQTLSTNEERADTLRAAITCHDAALKAYDRLADPAGWAATQHNRGLALLGLALLLDSKRRTQALRDAVSSFDAALEERRGDVLPFDYAETLVMKAATLTYLASGAPDRKEQVTQLSEAIACYDAALLVFRREVAPNYWVGTQVNKGGTLASLASVLSGPDRIETLQQAIACFDLALEQCSQDTNPTTWATVQANKGAALRDLFIAQITQGGEAPSATLQQALDCFVGALREHPRELQPAAHRQHALDAAQLYLMVANWVGAVPFLETALDAVDDLYSLSMTASGRAEQLSAGGDLTAHLAYALVRADGANAAERAAAILERGRARATGDAVRRHEEQLRAAGKVDPVLLAAFRAAADRFVSAGMLRAEPGLATEGRASIPALGQQYSGYDEAKAARAEYDMLLARIRAHPTLANFLMPTEPLPAAVSALKANERFLYLACSPVGLVAVLVGAGIRNDAPLSATAFWDEQLNGEESERLAQALLKAQETPGEQGERLDAALANVVETLGRPDTAFARLAAAYRDGRVERLIVIPCGLLGLLPLHAAPVPALNSNADSVLLQDVVRVSYTPSARIWQACRQHAEGQVDSAPDALVVGNPLPLPAGIPSLKGAAREARQVASLIVEQAHGGVRSIIKTAATREAVVTALRAASTTLTHAHFACHGIAAPNDPDQSSLILAHGEPLKVRDLLDPTLAVRFTRLRLATLSACQTGIPGTALPDEVVGLPTGWLQAGAAAVLASLWPVDDAATTALMQHFYELHLLDGLDPVDALWLAQRWLRGLSSWRVEHKEAGAARSAAGPEAPEVVRQLTQARGVTGDGEEEDGQDDGGETRAVGERGATGVGERPEKWQRPRIWAAFAVYGD